MATLQQAIIKTGGKQYRVTPGSRVRVEKLPADVGQKIELGEVLLVGSGADAKIGTPLVSGAKVKATITEHGRGPKLVVYKFKRRKNYRRKAGHRQSFTELHIDEIVA
jgi:large subunit ribosomal protein L21